jgi:signal transduction histidine kinase
VSPELVDVVTLARDAASLMGATAGVKGLGLVAELPDDSISLYTDSGKLRQVLLNLLSNAVKFTEKGGILLRVRRRRTASSSSCRTRASGLRRNTWRTSSSGSGRSTSTRTAPSPEPASA